MHLSGGDELNAFGQTTSMAYLAFAKNLDGKNGAPGYRFCYCRARKTKQNKASDSRLRSQSHNIRK